MSSTNDKLLVCTVFSGGERDRFWLELQHRQLQATVGTFDHAVYLGRRADPAMFHECLVVGRSTLGVFGQSGQEHLQGLQALTDYCRMHPYRGYLVLDSDAFPVAAGWETTLQGMLRRFKKKCAAAVRTENLDTFAHPSVVYVMEPKSLQFGYEESRNLAGEVVKDVTLLTPYVPLLKTNAVSPSPVLASIYLDLFYHHGCGSRKFIMRSTAAGYYDHILAHCASPDALYEQLQADPAGFIAGLMLPGSGESAGGSANTPYSASLSQRLAAKLARIIH
jgi:hypothetical protein